MGCEWVEEEVFICSKIPAIDSFGSFDLVGVVGIEVKY